ncbi:MAG: hypothetical protein M3Z06_04560, partial [Actinomycetota bacterium]|nr:hypothetical protein [Actinomycetota bacterium]
SSSSSSSTSTPAAAASASTPATTSTGNGVNPNAPESLPPGDIPDTIAYVPYAVPGHGLTFSTPEGWSRKPSTAGVTFTDKLNTIQLIERPATAPITAAAAQKSELPKIAAGLKGFKLQSVSTVSRPAGPAVLLKYLGFSQPDPVTGKFGVLAFERYEFSHREHEVTLLLSSPLGSDNVDPWRKVTTSLRFAR